MLADVTASTEAITLFGSVVAAMAGAIAVLFRMILSEQAVHRTHISDLVKTHNATIEKLKTEYLAVIKDIREECNNERILFLEEIRTERAIRAETEEKRQAIEQQRHSDYMALAHAINKFSDRKGNAQPPSR